MTTPHPPVDMRAYLEVELDVEFTRFLGRLAANNPELIKKSIGFDEATGGFLVTLWSDEDPEPVHVAQEDLAVAARLHDATDGPRQHAPPIWPRVLKIAEAKRRARAAD